MGDEIKAISQVHQALQGLEPDEVVRVLRWAVDKYDADELMSPPVREAPTAGVQGNEGGDASPDPATAVALGFARISDLMDAGTPANGTDYVLLGSYWFQELQGEENVTGQQVNAVLKDLGHGSSNITSTYTQLMRRKPPLVRQVQKSGSTRQARKRYRLTNEGVRAAERMLAGKTQD